MNALNTILRVPALCGLAASLFFAQVATENGVRTTAPQTEAGVTVITPTNNAGSDGTVNQATPPQPDRTDPVLEELRSLPELPAPTGWWANTPDEYFAEVSRICRMTAISIKFEVDPRRLDMALATRLPAVVHYSPDDREGRTVAVFAERFKQVVAAGLPVYAVVFDAEDLNVRKHGRWAIAQRNMALVDAVETVRPGTRIEWYGLGGEILASNSLGWCVDDNLSGIEPGNLAVSVYRPHEFTSSQHQVTATVERSIKEHRGDKITVWYALGWAYVRTIQGSTLEIQVGVSQPPEYTPAIAYAWGQRLYWSWFKRQDPDRFGRLDAVELVILYPGPLDPRHGEAGRQHFVHFVKGATNTAP